MVQKIALLGSTGSIGCNTLDVIRHLHPRFEVVSLSAGKNVEVLAEQVRTFYPVYVAVGDPQSAERLRLLLKDEYGGEIGVGLEGMVQAASVPEAEIVVSATVGGRGLLPTLRAIEL